MLEALRFGWNQELQIRDWKLKWQMNGHYLKPPDQARIQDLSSAILHLMRFGLYKVKTWMALEQALDHNGVITLYRKTKVTLPWSCITILLELWIFKNIVPVITLGCKEQFESMPQSLLFRHNCDLKNNFIKTCLFLIPL